MSSSVTHNFNNGQFGTGAEWYINKIQYLVDLHSTFAITCFDDIIIRCGCVMKTTARCSMEGEMPIEYLKNIFKCITGVSYSGSILEIDSSWCPQYKRFIETLNMLCKIDNEIRDNKTPMIPTDYMYQFNFLTQMYCINVFYKFYF